MKKKSVVYLMTAVMCTIALAGCGGDNKAETTDTGAQTTETQSDESQKVDKKAEGRKITMSHCQGEWTWSALEAVMDAYEAESGNMVELLYVPAEGYQTWLTTQFAGGTEPDVIFASASPAGDFYKNNWIIDLKPYFEKESAYTGKIWRDSFAGNILDGTIDPNGTGAMVGMPNSISMVNLYYNKDVFEEMGIKPKDVESWSGVLETAKKIKEKNPDMVPMSVQNSSSWNLGWQTNFMMEHIWKDMIAELDVIDKNGRLEAPEWALGVKSGKIQLDDQRMVDYFSFMKELSAYFNTGFNTASWEYEALFNEGKAAMNLNGSWFPSQYVQNNLSVNYGVLPQPYVDSNITDKTDNVLHRYSVGLGGPDVMVTQKSVNDGNGDVAIDFLQFMTAPDKGAKLFAEKLMWIPVVEGVDASGPIKDIIDTLGEDEQNVNWNAAMLGMTAEANDKFGVMFANFLDDSDITAEKMAADFKDLYVAACDTAIAEHPEWKIEEYLSK